MNWDSLLEKYPDQVNAILRAKALREIITRNLNEIQIPVLDEYWREKGLQPFVEILAPLCIDVWREYFGKPPPFDMNEILNSSIQGEKQPVIEGDANALEIIVNDSFSLLLHRMREKNPDLIPDSWEEGFCPFCNSYPHIAFDSETGRQVFCPMCGFSWRFRRFKCPVCNNTDHVTLGYLELDDLKGTRVYFCKQCNHYLKVVDVKLRKAQDFETEDTLSLELDEIALKEGFVSA